MVERRIKTKGILLLGFLFTFLIGGILLIVPPANGYEISIYRVYPWYFWALVIFSIFIGQLVILREAFEPQAEKSQWVPGVLLLMVISTVLLAMPYIRGYPVYGRADVLTHVGVVQSISTSATFGSNFYPSLHLLVFSISEFTGLEPMRIINFVPIAISILFLASTYLLLRETFDSRRKLLFALPFVMVLIGTNAHLLAAPYTQSVLFIPFILYLFTREQRTESRTLQLLFFLVAIFSVTFHPLSALFLILIFGINVMIGKMPQVRKQASQPTYPFVLLFTIFWAWHMHTGVLFRVSSFFLSLFGNAGGSSELQGYSSTLSRTSPRLIDLLELATFKFGTVALTTGLAALFILVAAILYQQGEFQVNQFDLTYVLSFILFVMISIILFATNLISSGFGRPLLFVKYISAILAGLLFYCLWRHIDYLSSIVSPLPEISKGTVKASTIIVLLVLTTILTYSVYFSPLQSRVNSQVSEKEIAGADWAFEHRNNNLRFDEFGISHSRFYDLLYGDRAERENIRRQGTTPPPHFGYETESQVGQHYQNDTYLLITRLGRITYPKKFPDYREYWSFTPEDFRRLERDSSVNRLYDNGEFNQYRIDANVTQDN